MIIHKARIRKVNLLNIKCLTHAMATITVNEVRSTGDNIM